MPRPAMTGTGSDLFTRSQRQGGFHTFADVHRGPRTGADGAIMRAVYGEDPLDFAKAVEWEMAMRQHRQPGRFVSKIVPGKPPKRRRKP